MVSCLDSCSLRVGGTHGVLGPAAEEAPLGPGSLRHPSALPAVSAVSNEVPEHPCVSPVSNHIYERRLIEKYIAENGTDPINNQPLSEEQLVDIKGAWRPPVCPSAARGGSMRGRSRSRGGRAGRGRVPPGGGGSHAAPPLSAVAHPIRPKPPSATSIPAILKALQDEWVSPWERTGAPRWKSSLDGAWGEDGAPCSHSRAGWPWRGLVLTSQIWVPPELHTHMPCASSSVPPRTAWPVPLRAWGELGSKFMSSGACFICRCICSTRSRAGMW